jgi:phosphohistidine phosphatase SixA
MNLYLIRHGDAERISGEVQDFNRKLTPEGEFILRAAVKNWKNLIPSFDHIISSPYIRAIKTGKIIASEYNLLDKFDTNDKLSCGSKTEDIIEIANSLDGKNIALIGHEPDFSNHLSKLISSTVAFASFKKGAIAKIIFNNKAALSRGVLEFLIPAEIFYEKKPG